METKGLIYTNDNCVSCYKCVRVCTSPGASYLLTHDGVSSVMINPNRCVTCGACFALCDHHAREYRDNTDEFLRDLREGKPVSILLAPSFRASYPKEYGQLLGRLKALGVRRMINVSFGADICTWAYLKYMEQNSFRGAISTPCPVAVSYVEHYLPELIPRLMPVYSPMVCAAIYCREELGITDRFAFIGPCIGKELEMDTYFPESPVHYNVTFLKLMEALRDLHTEAEDASDEIEYGIGSFYPAPGGLADNIRWFLGDDAQVRVVSGKTYLYGWLRKNANNLLQQKTPFELIDALNCQNGCIEGTAGEEGHYNEDAALYSIGEIRAESKSSRESSPWNGSLTSAERLEMLNRQFSGLSLSHYLRTFTDRSEGCGLKIPTPEEEDRIFREMHKLTEKARTINCSTCGYNTCRDLMIAIHNGFNDKQSCIHFEKEEALRIERLFSLDPVAQVMNRTALESRKISLKYCRSSVSVVMADINGLKEANDRKGHDAGDRLIATIAACLSEVFGQENVFRIGGDEFVAILLDHTEEECAVRIRKAKEAMAEMHVSAAIGYAFRPVFDCPMEELQKLADLRMYEEKKQYYRETGKTRRVLPDTEPGE